MSQPVIFDLETKKTFREAGSDDPGKLGVSVVGTYSYETDEYKAFKEEEFDKMFRLFENASLLIGFNILHFDLPALKPYYVGSIHTFKTLDLLETIKESIGIRIALNEFAKTTLGMQKSGHGLDAINYYNEGRWDELIRYCLDDVRITKGLYEYGKREGKIFYNTAYGKKEVKVDWNGHEKNSNVHLTLGL